MSEIWVKDSKQSEALMIDFSFRIEIKMSKIHIK